MNPMCLVKKTLRPLWIRILMMAVTTVTTTVATTAARVVVIQTPQPLVRTEMHRISRVMEVTLLKLEETAALLLEETEVAMVVHPREEDLIPTRQKEIEDLEDKRGNLDLLGLLGLLGLLDLLALLAPVDLRGPLAELESLVQTRILHKHCNLASRSNFARMTFPNTMDQTMPS